VIATVLVMMAVFLPTAMMQGIVGKLYQQFALTIAGSIGISGICGVTLAPALCAILLRPSIPKEKRFVGFRIFNYFFDGFGNFYLKTVKTTIWFAPVILLLWFGLVGVLYIAVTILPHGFFPSEDQGVLMMEVKLPEGATMERTTEVLTRVEKIIAAEQTLKRNEDYEKRGFFTRLYERFWDKKKTYVESGGVKAAMYLNGISFFSGQGSNLGFVFIPLKVWEERKVDEWHLPGFPRLQKVLNIFLGGRFDEGLRIPAIQARIQKGLDEIPEAAFMIVAPPPIQLGMANGVEYMLLAERDVKPTELARARDDLLQTVKDMNPIVHVLSPFNPNSPQIYLDIDRDKAKRMGVPLTEVYAALQTYLGATYVNDFPVLGRTYQVNVQAKGEYRTNIQDVLRMKVKNLNGEMVTLEAFTTVKEISGPQLLTRYNMFPSAKMTCILRPGASTGDGIKKMERQELPDGFTSDWTGLTFQEKRVGTQTAVFFAISILFAFLILAAQYESWSSPLIIMMAVPLGVAGSLTAVILFTLYRVGIAGIPEIGNFIALMMCPFQYMVGFPIEMEKIAPVMMWLFNAEINLYTQIGLLMMVGLSAKNAILITEFARERREHGAGLVQSAYEAGRLRLRPIFMTSFAFILGVLPLVWADGAGSNARNAIGNGVFGGLLMETMVGVYVTPVLFVLIQGTAEWFNRHMQAFLHHSRTKAKRLSGLDEITLRHGD
jgi:multidrug efflux pump subunit AcrB